MRYPIIFFLMLFFSLPLFAQYTVTTEQANYVEIEDYNSLQLETGGDILPRKDFELPFSFPFFEFEFTSLFLNHKSFGSVENDINFSIRLLNQEYILDIVTDPSDIPSDIRYKYGEKDGKQYLVLQYTKVRLQDDSSIEKFDSHVNFQTWFYEDGQIDVIVGPSNLENSSIYRPGDGFWYNDGQIKITTHLALYHPYIEDVGISYQDGNSYDDYEVRNDQSGTINWWPEEGWKVSFKNKLTSNDDALEISDLNVFPNPVEQELYVENGEDIERYEVYDIQGTLMLNGSLLDKNYLDLGGLAGGVYILSLSSDQITTNTKIIKL